MNAARLRLRKLPSPTYAVKWFIAAARLNDRIICEMSENRGPYNDFHDYPDSETGPWHFGAHECVRCGKAFYI